MLTRDRSKRSKQIKYLFSIPVLVAMLVYVSCSNQLEDSLKLKSSEKQTTVYYNAEGRFNLFEEILEEKREKMKGFGLLPNEQKTYFDQYSDRVDPPFGTPISESDLTTDELEEYNEFVSRREPEGFAFWSKVGLYQLDNGRKMIAVVWDFSMDGASYDPGNVDPVEEVAFSIIDKIPTFPGCPENDRKCFNKNMQKHFAVNFDSDLPKKAGLSPGKKRVIMQFAIDRDGKVSNIDVRAPDVQLVEEAERIINQLPEMIPGEHQGKKVMVKYTLPMRIDVK